MNVDTKKYKERSLLAQISHAKDELITPDEMLLNAADFNEKKVAEIYREYQNSLRRNNALDFDDLIVKTVELFQHWESVSTVSGAIPLYYGRRVSGYQYGTV